MTILDYVNKQTIIKKTSENLQSVILFVSLLNEADYVFLLILKNKTFPLMTLLFEQQKIKSKAT